MYNPRSFKVEDVSQLHTLIREFNFGIVISHSEGTAVATHLPFMIDAKRGANGTLIAHMARANPHWETWTEETELMVIFQGPHSYISPAWYQEQATVPTWNYATVHAYGRPVLIHEPENLRPMVKALVELHEEQIGRPWDISQMERVMETELKAIVGFEIAIERLEGKFKFNQNRTVEDQRAVVSALEESGNSNFRAVAAIMKKNLSETGTF